MNEHPILFSTETIKAILDGRKTQTRRVVKPQPDTTRWDYTRVLQVGEWFHIEADEPEPVMFTVTCPYGQAGDRLWVRETWRRNSVSSFHKDDFDRVTIEYKAQPEKGALVKKFERPRGERLPRSDQNGLTWKPSIFMPRWASRITLEVVSVRVERLQEISHADAVSEGMYCYHENYQCALDDYRDLWNHINAKSGYPWENDPFVWVVEFRKI